MLTGDRQRLFDSSWECTLHTFQKKMAHSRWFFPTKHLRSKAWMSGNSVSMARFWSTNCFVCSPIGSFYEGRAREKVNRTLSGWGQTVLERKLLLSCLFEWRLSPPGNIHGMLIYFRKRSALRHWRDIHVIKRHLTIIELSSFFLFFICNCIITIHVRCNFLQMSRRMQHHCWFCRFVEFSRPDSICFKIDEWTRVSTYVLSSTKMLTSFHMMNNYFRTGSSHYQTSIHTSCFVPKRSLRSSKCIYVNYYCAVFMRMALQARQQFSSKRFDHAS